MTRARWAVAPRGRVAHRWRLFRDFGGWKASSHGQIMWADTLRPPGDAKRCKRCEKSRKR